MTAVTVTVTRASTAVVGWGDKNKGQVVQMRTCRRRKGQIDLGVL
jgi:hypothetical protein